MYARITGIQIVQRAGGGGVTVVLGLCLLQVGELIRLHRFIAGPGRLETRDETAWEVEVKGEP